MNILFQPAPIKNLQIKNRFVRSATYDGYAKLSGHVSERQIDLITALAEGGVGLIIHAITYVHKSGQVSPYMNSLANDEFISGMQKLTKAAHKHGAKIAIQLFHGGREARYVKTKHQLPLAPSVIADDPYYKGNYREITSAEIEEVIKAFGEGARRARQAGFDAVQIHGAHGYLPSQFLSPYTNRRQDEWGGNLENRLRLHREIYKAMRRNVGDEYPVLIKLGVADGFAEGLALSEGIQAAKMLADLGYDALEISSGVRGQKYSGTEYRTKINKISKEAYFRSWSREIKAQVDIPIMAVGGFRTFGIMEEIIRNKEADFVALCRPLISEPALICQWEKDPNKKARCISCNKCLEAVHRGKPLHCIPFPNK
jgi:2,4-dienoyl-CoA reductase-like NADH-dependent reductase (Old Yellow Enzyme family)